jgi:hypothetical protein
MAETQLSGSDNIAKIIAYADIHGGDKKVKVEKRKLDAAPQATFNYGDGKYLMLFSYKKDGKAAERAGKQQAKNAPDDSKDEQKKLPEE